MTRSTTSAVEVDCTRIEGAAPGERVVSYASTVEYGYVRQWVTDASGGTVCVRDGNAGCELPGAGPYRVLSYVVDSVDSEAPVDYQIQVGSLSDPVGCPSVQPGDFGAAPASPAGQVRCRLLDVPAAGAYTVDPVDTDRNASVWSYVYDSAGRQICQGGDTGACTFPAAGSYPLVIGDPTRVADATVADAFLDRAGTQGCVPAAGGLNEGTLSAPGQFDCLQLSAPQGARIAALAPNTSDHVQVEAVDRDGLWQCGADTLSAGTCALTGTAPYRLLVHAAEYEQPSPYGVDVVGTDVPSPGCAVFPQSTFTDESNAVHLTTGRTQVRKKTDVTCSPSASTALPGTAGRLGVGRPWRHL
ncbi:hypothetical protein [Streptomyces sp.]|uniref:hypothetical protein n=1 Tax=Streptomyces sp. TaxID=1931 RepID=UPI002F4232CB